MLLFRVVVRRPWHTFAQLPELPFPPARLGRSGIPIRRVRTSLAHRHLLTSIATLSSSGFEDEPPADLPGLITQSPANTRALPACW
ncbi:MAG: hypothetical protein M3460_12745, partial [Actinomycetota bacterium]|nr:hypothetical protein [Actinomycetota bacterium]